jgi:hypothetical protein
MNGSISCSVKMILRWVLALAVTVSATIGRVGNTLRNNKIFSYSFLIKIKIRARNTFN